MIDFTLEVEEEDFLRELDALEMDVVLKLLHVFDQVGWEVISFLRSLTSETRPPVRPGEPSRRAHPGGWADVTSNLANAYRYELHVDGRRMRWMAPVLKRTGEAGLRPLTPIRVNGGIPDQLRHLPKEISLGFFNGMEYAAYLEARDGFWILREVTEAGGPVQRAVRTVIARVAPDAELR